MRRSREVPLTILAAVAVTLTGCREERSDCVDAQNRKLPDSSCQIGSPGAHYVYGGSSGGNFGDTVVGGSVTRGGFGGTGGSGGGDAAAGE